MRKAHQIILFTVAVTILVLGGAKMTRAGTTDQTGPCIGHGQRSVNCSLGIGPRGSVKCSLDNAPDNFMTDDYNFFEVPECVAYAKEHPEVCSPPFISGCETKASVALKMKEVDKISKMSKIDKDNFKIWIKQECQKAVAQNNVWKQGYKDCAGVISNNSCKKWYGSESYLDKKLSVCACSANSKFEMIDNKCVTLDQLCKRDDVNTTINKKTKECVCVKGYKLDKTANLCTLVNQKGFKFTKVLNERQYGLKWDVVVLQKFLIKKGYFKPEATVKGKNYFLGYGFFSPSTRDALKNFQKDNNLEQTGDLDQATLNFINKQL